MAEAELLLGNFQKSIENLFSAWKLNFSTQNQTHFYFVLNELNKELKLGPKEIFSAFDSGSKLKIQSKEFTDQRIENYRLALFFSEKSKWDSADFHTENLKEFQPYYTFLKAKILSGQNDFDAALFNLKSIGKNIQNVELRKNIDELISDNYLAKNDLENYKNYYFQFITLNDSLNLQKEQARIFLISKLDELQIQKSNSIQNHQQSAVFLFSGLIFLSFTAGFFYHRKLKSQTQKFIQNQLETKRKLEETKTNDGNKIVIPDKTIQIILEKLDEFEQSNAFLDAGISLQTLAENLNTNTKYLSEIINNHKNKNFHFYINELRINYIISKLENDPIYLKYKVSALAEASGFTSHSTFSTVFKQITGDSPAAFINQLKNKEKPENS